MLKEADMPTLLIINVTCNQGSTGKIAEQVGVMMKKRGWDVYYAHGARRVNSSQLKTIPFSSVRAEYIHALRSRIFDDDGLGSKRETKNLVEKIKVIKPDIIHIHNIHGYYINYKILFEYLNSTNIQVVMTLHDCWSFTGHCPHFVTANCEKWKIGCHHCPLKDSDYKKSLIDRSRRNFKLKKQYIAENSNLHLIPVSYWLGDLVKQSIYQDKDIDVIQNGIDLSVFRPLSPNVNKKYSIIGVSNVWHDSKGFSDILSLRQLLDKDSYEITLVGVSQRQKDDLPDGIIGILSTANQEELAALYSKSDVLINPTYADTFPTVNLEALACGTPVISYRTGGSPEAVDETTGVVVEQGDINALADAIRSMKKHSLSSDDCRKRAEDCFDKDKSFEKYIELYEGLINKIR